LILSGQTRKARLGGRQASAGGRKEETGYPPNECCHATEICRRGIGGRALMGLYVGSTVIDTFDMEKGVAFWSAALGYVVRDSDATFAVLTDPRRRWSNVSLQHSEKSKRDRNRLHIDLHSEDWEVDVARLESLGATRVTWEYAPGADYVVMADPDGNEFCVVQSHFSQE
jgi:predicted enzyme related to lactoylglutathione lyase